jgi:hypothetical protein
VTYNLYIFPEKEKQQHICGYRKDVHRTKCQALTITRLTHSRKQHRQLGKDAARCYVLFLRARTTYYYYNILNTFVLFNHTQVCVRVYLGVCVFRCVFRVWDLECSLLINNVSNNTENHNKIQV